VPGEIVPAVPSSTWLFPEAKVIGAETELRVLEDSLLLSAKAALEPDRSIKQKASETGILKPNIFTDPKNVAPAEFALSEAEWIPLFLP
jgi:hypothetical protein